MFILVLETKSGVDGKALRLVVEPDEGKFEIWRGQYEQGNSEQGRWERKGEYKDLDNALGVYINTIPGLIK